MLAAENRSLPVLSACKRERMRLRLPCHLQTILCYIPHCMCHVLSMQRHFMGCSHVMHHNTTPFTRVNTCQSHWSRSHGIQETDPVPPAKPADLGMQNRCGVESGNKLKAASTVVSMVEMRVDISRSTTAGNNMHERIFLRSRFYPGLRG